MKQGFCLIEVLISISLILFLTFHLSRLFIKENTMYNNFMVANRTSIDIKEALEFIEYELKNSWDQVEVNKNTINLYSNGYLNKKIESNHGKLLIYTYKYRNKCNVILKNVSDFKVEINQNNLYLMIEVMGRKKKERCLKI